MIRKNPALLAEVANLVNFTLLLGALWSLDQLVLTKAKLSTMPNHYGRSKELSQVLPPCSSADSPGPPWWALALFGLKDLIADFKSCSVW